MLTLSSRSSKTSHVLHGPVRRTTETRRWVRRDCELLNYSSTMKFAAIIMVIISLTDSRAPKHMEDRIVGGYKIPIRRAPFQASYVVNRKLKCGATIIAIDAVLTAAHCVRRSDKNVTIRVGTDLRFAEGSRHRMKEAIVHESFDDKPPYHNDISIIFVDPEFELSSAVQPIELTTQRPRRDDVGYVTGFGRLEEKGNSSEVLMRTDLYISDKKSCNTTYKNRLLTSQICAQHPMGGRDSCQGDSGGPLVVGNRLVGITSYGRGCGRQYYPGVYTSVADMLCWIHDKLTVHRVRKRSKYQPYVYPY